MRQRIGTARTSPTRRLRLVKPGCRSAASSGRGVTGSNIAHRAGPAATPRRRGKATDGWTAALSFSYGLVDRPGNWFVSLADWRRGWLLGGALRRVARSVLGRLAGGRVAFGWLVAGGLAVGGAAPAHAATEVAWWHAMSGQLGCNSKSWRSISTPPQSDYRIVPSYKGNYTETVTAAIFAFRSRSQPAIVQVNEIATATMMAAKGAIYPVFELMRDEKESFQPAAYLPAVDRLLHRPRRQHAVVPVQRLDADPVLQQGACSAPPASTPRWRRRPGPSSAPRPSSLRAVGRGLRLHHVMAVLGQCREFLRLSTICRWPRNRTASAGSTRC